MRVVKRVIVEGARKAVPLVEPSSAQSAVVLSMLLVLGACREGLGLGIHVAMLTEGVRPVLLRLLCRRCFDTQR